MNFDNSGLSESKLTELYQKLLYPRLIEEKMLLLLRQNKISKWFSGIGQEAISVGSTAAMESDEYILPLHRNLGVFTGRNIPLTKLFSQWQGKAGGFTKGRDRSFHFGTNEYHIVGMISHLGPQLSVAGGIALADLLENRKKATLVFTGDGGTSEGDFHEALNVASVWKLPVIFTIEHNGYGLSTPNNEQFTVDFLAKRGIAYNMRSITIDGNNILEVYNTFDKIAKEIRENPEPVIIECMTFRMRGHEESSGTKYVPKELFDIWEKKDPIANYEKYLIESNVLSQKNIDEIRKEIKHQINDDIDSVIGEEDIVADTSKELADVYKSYHFIEQNAISSETKQMRFVDAISNGLDIAMQKHDNLILMGQDIADYGGVFKITDGFVDRYGKDRVRNTPLCESAILGCGVGLSVKGYKSVIEMQFADFVTCGFNQIVNNAAKLHWRWGQNVDMVVRMPTGAGVGAGPFHSQSTESWFMNVPGLKIVYPSSPYDAKGLMISAIEDPNPVMFFEHKYLYRHLSEEVPSSYYNIEIGKAKLLKEGIDISIITYGLGVVWAKKLADELSDISFEIIDLRTLLPLDFETIEKSVSKTGKVLILHEDTLTCGIGAEIAAIISKKCFKYLDAPIYRVASLDTPVPFATNLEQNFFPLQRMKTEAMELYKW